MSDTETKEDTKLASAKEVTQDSPTSNEGCSLHVSGLSRNINSAHLKEIFGHFGPVKNVDLQVDPRLNISKGFAYVEYENADDASKGHLYMGGGQIDGNRIKVTFVLVSNKRARANSRSPAGGPRGRRSVSPPGSRQNNSRPQNNSGGPDNRGGARGGDRDRDRRRPVDDWRGGGRGGGGNAGGRGRSPDRRRERSPVGNAYGGARDRGYRRGPSPIRRRSPIRDRGVRRSRSRSPRRRVGSPMGWDRRGTGGRGGSQRPRSRERDTRRSRSPAYRRRRGRSSSASSSPSVRRGRGRRSSSVSSRSSSSSRSRSRSYSSSSRSRSSSESRSKSPAKP